MIENLISTTLFAILVLYEIGLIFDFYEARKNKNKIESFIYSLLLFVVSFFIINCPMFSWSVYNFMQEDEYMWLDICRRYDIVVEWCNK